MHVPKDDTQRLRIKSPASIHCQMGFNRKMSCAIRYGPVSMGGVGLVQFKTIQGTGQMMNFLKHWRSYTYVGSLLRCTLAWAQMNAGIGTPLLMTPSLTLSYFESTFLQYLREYLAKINCQIEVDTPYIPPTQREDDEYIMEVAIATRSFEDKELRKLNYCRLYLQVVTIADMVIPDSAGNQLDPSMVYGINVDRPISVSNYCQTNQAKPSRGSWKVWQRLCDIIATMLENHPLGRWTVPGNKLRRDWNGYFDHGNKRLYMRQTEHTFYEMEPNLQLDKEVFITTEQPRAWEPSPTSVPIYAHQIQITDRIAIDGRVTARAEVSGGVADQCGVHSDQCDTPGRTKKFHEQLLEIPKAERDLLSRTEFRIPEEEVTEILNQSAIEPSEQNNHLQSQCYGVSDGSEARTSMAFGWVVAAPDGFRLATGSGPAFGSQPSSFRAEGYGMLSMVKFLLQLRQTSGSTDQWKIQCATDSQGLVTAVKNCLTYDEPFPNVTLDPEYDIIHEIVMTCRQAKLEVVLSHVKGHQNTRTDFDELTLPEQLNIEADELAREYRIATNNIKRPLVPMLQHTRCLVHSNDTDTITRAYRQTLRNLVATPAIRNQMAKSFRWSPSTIDLVDWGVFEKCRSKMQTRAQQMTKLGFNILPTASVVAKGAKSKSDICPLCETDPETNDHLCQCSATQVRLWRSTVILELGQLLEKRGIQQGLGETLMRGIISVFESKNAAITLECDLFPRPLRQLITEQNLIGWRQLFRGRVSTQWAKIQQSMMPDYKQKRTSQGRHG
eukprot:scaffold12690_cov177-Cylindrotheca_fusiformis.AAC.2